MMHEAFKRLHPEAEIADVGGGGVKMARDIALGAPCDVYASVDYSNIPDLLIPRFANWYVVFASTGFVLRYTEKSPFAEEINEDNWIEIVQRNDVPLWRSDPEGDPAGYRSLMVYQLAEGYYGIPGLCEKLAAKSGKRYLSAALLAERDKGYCFSYSSHLMGGKGLALPDEINLSNEAFSDRYRQAKVTIRSLEPGKTVTIRGEAIRLGATIPTTCANRKLAVAWMRMLLGETGRAILEKAGKRPLKPAFGGDLDKVPEPLGEGIL
jgi:molybdate/tungstate transport system substrate-binding protein